MTVGWFFVIVTVFTGLIAWIAMRASGPRRVVRSRTGREAANNDPGK